jgi:hypothetical protein
MARGQASSPGDTRIAPNGYHYTRTTTKWELTHKLILEEKLGRKLRDNERCRFIDGDRNNLSPDNLTTYEKKERSNGSRRAQLEARIADLQAQLEDLEAT